METRRLDILFVHTNSSKKIYQDLVRSEGKDKAIKILRKSSIKQVLPSDRALQNIINSNRSLPNTLSSNDKYWNDVIIDLEQDNYNNVQPYMDYLRKQMRKVEDLYFDRNLSKEPPDLEIESN